MLTTVHRIARKLRDGDLRELRVRGTQAVAALLERSGWSGGDAAPAGDAAARLARFRDRPELPDAPRFFGAFDDPAATVAALRARCPDDEAEVLARAERVLQGRFDLLGYEGLSFGEPIDWHRDPVAGKRAPDDVHWSRVPYLDAAVVGDHKVVWEINRHQYFVALGQAYWYTGDERFARAWAAHLESWCAANPPKLGINWASALEVAYRSISWIWALHYFRASSALTPALFGRVLAVLDLNGRHLERYLSTYFSPNTHLTGEALGLLYLGTAFPELGRAARWRSLGRTILLDQLAPQIRADGVYFEQASQYHRYTVEIFLHLQLLAALNGDDEAAAAAREPVSALFTHLLHLTRADGTIPLVGDDDGGRLVQLDGRPARDVRSLLAVGAAVFGRGDLAFGARLGGDDRAAVAWLLGPDGMRALDAAVPTEPADRSRAFPDGGYYVLRDRWDATGAWAVVDCGPHGAMNCGHAHADALAIEVAAGGRALLVDPGTYSYLPPERNAFRHGRAHNTLTVDGESSSVPATPFAWAHVARCATRTWELGAHHAFVEGEHDGFTRLADPVVHERAVLFVTPRAGDPAPSYWVVRDRVRGNARHAVAAHWHAAAGLTAHVDAGQTPDGVGGVGAELRDATGGGPLLRLVVFGHEGGALRVDDGWVSPAYGARVAAPVLRWEQVAEGIQELITFVLPVAPGAAVPVVRRRPSGGEGSRAFAVEGAGWTDLLLLGDGAPVTCDGAVTDADCAVVRRCADAPAAALAVIRGRLLRLDGVDLNRS